MIPAKFSNELAIIGSLLTGYADLEIGLLNCVQVATGDFDATLKAMFGKRGEAARINSGAALGRPVYDTLGLVAEFDEAVAAMAHCLKIRNQYAHHNFWDDYTDQLAIGDLEKVALSPDHQASLGAVVPNHVTVELLAAQHGYFRFTDHLFAWVNFEGRVKAGKADKNMIPPLPATRPDKPDLHI